MPCISITYHHNLLIEVVALAVRLTSLTPSKISEGEDIYGLH